MLSNTPRLDSRDGLRQEDRDPDAADEPDQDEQDNLAAARGILYGAGIVSLIWLLLVVVILLVWRHWL